MSDTELRALRTDLVDLRIRSRMDRQDHYAKHRSQEFEFQLADALFFRRLCHRSSSPLEPATPRNDPVLDRLHSRLERSLAVIQGRAPAEWANCHQ